MDFKKRIEHLVNHLKKWEYEYYNDNNPSVSDYEYDAYLKELIELEVKYPQYKIYNSPTDRVGGTVSKKFKKIKHTTKMLSLSNAFNYEMVEKFHSDINKVCNNFDGFVIEPKIDGLSISIQYENGHLVKALTRGDGIFGEDVTNNAKTIYDIPLEIKYKKLLEVRGEVYLSKEEFEKLNKNSITKFANQRNAAAGSMRVLDSSITAKRKLNCFFYMIINPDNHDLNTQFEVISFLNKNGFKTSSVISHETDLKNVWRKILEIQNYQKNYNFDCDGVVIKVNKLSLYQIIGETSKFPKWAIAYKFPAEIKQSKLLNIIVSVGRTGKINYIAEIVPININGTIVTNATLHNYDYIKSKNILINDWVNVLKAGEIIPRIISVDYDKRDGNEIYFPIPYICPSCGFKLVSYTNEIDLYCTNDNCQDKKIESLIHFCSRNAMNIEGLSKKIITKLFKNKFIEKWQDFYNLDDKKEFIMNADLNLKEKSLNNLLKSVEKSKSNSLEKLLFALGIRHIGENASKKLAKSFFSLDNLARSSSEQILIVDEIGYKMAESLTTYFKINPIDELVNFLDLKKINYVYKSEMLDFNDYYMDSALFKKFGNKKIVITGSFPTKRIIIKEILENKFLMKVINKISKETNFLLIGEGFTQSKFDIAKKLSIEIIDYEFWKENNKN
ncbi:MAG: NAD-dependent DNA ligase LigA [Mycoplasmoidaceae bacterium]